MGHSVRASDHTLGHWEGMIFQNTKSLQRALLEQAAHKEADATPPVLSVPRPTLTRQTHGLARAFESRLAPLTVQRRRRRSARISRPCGFVTGPVGRHRPNPWASKTRTALLPNEPAARTAICAS